MRQRAVAHCHAGADRLGLNVGQDDAEAGAWSRGAAKITGCAAGPCDHDVVAPQRRARLGGQPRVGPCLLARLVVAVPVDERGAAAGDPRGEFRCGIPSWAVSIWIERIDVN
jgi:hypothetical protein